MSGQGFQRIRFDVPARRPGQLTWGQLAIWEVFEWLPDGDDSLNQVGWCSITAPVPGAGVARLLGQLIERHEALRTVYFEHGGQPMQRVLAKGEVIAREVDCTTADLTVCAVDLGRQLRCGAFDHAHDIPVRAMILTVYGKPAAVVLVVNHLVVDGWSFGIVMDELRTCMTSGDMGQLPARGPQPLDRAEFERSDAGQCLEGATMAFWADGLRRVPEVMMSKSATPDDARRDWARISSISMARAVQLISVDTGTTTGMVILACVALLLSMRTGADAAALRLIVATRADNNYRDLVGPLNQNGLFHVAMKDESFEEYIRRACAATLAAYLRCEGDPRKVESLASGIAHERGFLAGHYCFFNDVRFEGADMPIDASVVCTEKSSHYITDPQWRTHLESLQLGGRQIRSKFFLYLDKLDDRCELTLCLDPEFLGVYTAADFLADLEQVLIQGATQAAILVSALVAKFQDPDCRWRAAPHPTAGHLADPRPSGGRCDAAYAP